jgi:hypothetical protein
MGSCFERLEAPLTVAFNSADGYGAEVIKNLSGFSPESVKFSEVINICDKTLVFFRHGLE